MYDKIHKLDLSPRLFARRKRLGCGSRVPDPNKTMVIYVRAVWDTLSGGSSFYSAFCEILNGRVDDALESLEKSKSEYQKMYERL